MWYRRLCGAALSSGLLAIGFTAAPARADETFLCGDGTSVTITNANRATMQEHPCVRAWFANDVARRQAQNTDTEEKSHRGGLAPHAYPVRRALALRDLQQRPAYIAWIRTRTTELAPAPRRERSYARSLLDQPAAKSGRETQAKTASNAPTRRFRFRRR